MIQALLTLAIIGLVVAHFLAKPISREGFSSCRARDVTKPKNSSAFLSEGFAPLPQDVGFLTEHSDLEEDRDGDDHLNLQPLQDPRPYHPMGSRPPPESPADPRRKVATPYRDLKPNDQNDVETDDDPRDLPWIASWSAADRFARQGHNCAVKYTTKGQDGTTIITTSKSCEAGMPHTRAGNRIIIPDSIPEPLRDEIIEHELVHVYQRRFPEPWATFYRRNWSFVLHKAPPASMPASVREARRANPDTFELPWPCWKERIWPVPVYTNPKTPSLREARTVWWDDQQRKLLLEPPAEWTAFFGSQSQDEHPHEMAAVMIVGGDNASEAGRRLMNWWRTGGRLTKSSRYSE